MAATTDEIAARGEGPIPRFRMMGEPEPTQSVAGAHLTGDPGHDCRRAGAGGAGLHGVGDAVGDMNAGWLVVACGLEILSCVGYIVAFLQVFDRAPVRFGARVALSELAFGAAVSLGGAGSIAVGAWLLVDRGGDPARIAERSAVLFLLTSAINVMTLVLAGLGLWSGFCRVRATHCSALCPPRSGAPSWSSLLCRASASGWRPAGRPDGCGPCWSRPRPPFA